MKTLVIAIFSLFIFQPTFSQNQLTPKQKAKFHEFDFWLGEWDVFKHGNDTVVAQSHIQTINDSMGILENYQSNGGYKGKSLNIYNSTSDKWQQFWIDNSGFALSISGGLEDGKMVMETEKSDDEPLKWQRITWSQEADGSVRQTWQQTEDGGKSWSTLFDGDYRRKK